MRPDQPPPVSPRKIKLYGTVALGVLAAVVVTGVISRSKGDAELKQWTDAQAIPSVAVALPGTKPLNATLDLCLRGEPCQERRNISTGIYQRTPRGRKKAAKSVMRRRSKRIAAGLCRRHTTRSTASRRRRSSSASKISPVRSRNRASAS